MSKLTKEPQERFLHRLECPNMGFGGNCYKHSGSCSFGDGSFAHITMGCNGDCRRMKIWDTKQGYKGVEFKLQEIL
jgi:hypothetical protein